MKKAFGTLLFIAFMMAIILSLKYALLYDHVPSILVAVDLITSSMFMLPVSIGSILLARFDVWRSLSNSIASAMIFFSAIIAYTIYSASQINLTQKIGGEYAFSNGVITQYGLLIFSSVSFLLAFVLWFALYKNHKFYRQSGEV